MTTIINGKDRPINIFTGTVPDVSGALKDTFQNIVFTQILKAVDGFQAVEVPTSVSFWGNIQPFKPRDLLLFPEGQRSWTWLRMFAEPGIILNTDDVATWLGKQTRVMSRTDYAQFGYIEYSLVQDWTNSGPNPPLNTDWDGGGAFTTYWPATANGGNANAD